MVRARRKVRDEYNPHSYLEKPLGPDNRTAMVPLMAVTAVVAGMALWEREGWRLKGSPLSRIPVLGDLLFGGWAGKGKPRTVGGTARRQAPPQPKRTSSSGAARSGVVQQSQQQPQQVLPPPPQQPKPAAAAGPQQGRASSSSGGAAGGQKKGGKKKGRR